MESDRTSPSRSESISDNQPRVRPLQGRTFGPSRRSTKGQWTPEEDEILRDAVQRFKGKNWKKIAQSFKERTDVQCLHRWQKVLNPDLVKGPWSKEEDETIIELVKKHGPKKWSTIAQHLPGRIGKQCRERWHNHLNPNINKEAWTQEEELALIRAHQVYGNKWAELSKFLPGRSDNAIKNHWNSSVKKKLDSYLASGLLSQFQGLPNSIPTIQSVGASSSKTPHSSEEDSPARDGAEMEEVSQGSQGSAAIGCSQSKSDLGSTSMSTGKDFLEYTLPHEWGASMVKDWRMNQNNLLDKPSLDLGQDMSGQFLHSLSAPFLHSSNYSGNNGTPSFPLQYSACLSSSTSMVNMALATDKSDCIFAQEEGGKIIGPEPSAHCPSPFQNNTMDGASDSLQYQSLNYQNHASTLESCYPERYGLLGPSSCQPFYAPSQPTSDDGSLLFGMDPIVFSDSTVGHEDHNILPDRNDGFIHSNDTRGSPSHYRQEDTGMTEQLVQGLDTSRVLPVNSFGSEPPENIHYREEYAGMAEQLDQGLDTSRAIPVNSFGSEPPDNIHCSPALGDVSVVSDEQKDSGALFYEPPRFPSFDIPFFSCDLLQPNSEMQQEYSPLGIRQFMMSSINCPTPFKLWDSPSRDDSPDAVLKSAAKTFTCTPSILKKRHRDLSSPLSERRTEKKLESTSSMGSFSSLARGFSRLEVMFTETANENPSVPSQLPNHDTDHGDENKENKDPGSLEEQKEGKRGLLNSKTGRLDKDTDGSAPHDNIKQLAGVERLCTVATRGVASSETPLSVVCSPRSLGKKDGSDLATVTSMNLPTSFNPLEKVENPGSSSGVENSSIFGGTPFKRSIESPSAWKSPWFINSFVPGPRVDTDITVEDMEFFMSPAERSYDALGLMKQLSEQTASAFATAQEVLGNETPKTISKNTHNQEQKDEMEGIGDNKYQPEGNSPAGSTIMAPECRTLDFSECGTPGKVTENGMSSNGIKFSTSSSYLLKGCR